MQRETKIQTDIRTAVSQGPQRLWRNNVGEALYPKTAKAKRIVANLLRLGEMVRVKYGLRVDSSDLIGYRSVTIEPHMVGQKVAIFVAMEVKTFTGQPTPGQRKFLDHVIEAGGIAGVVRSVEDAEQMLALTEVELGR